MGKSRVRRNSRRTKNVKKTKKGGTNIMQPIDPSLFTSSNLLDTSNVDQYKMLDIKIDTEILSLNTKMKKTEKNIDELKNLIKEMHVLLNAVIDVQLKE